MQILSKIPPGSYFNSKNSKSRTSRERKF